MAKRKIRIIKIEAGENGSHAYQTIDRLTRLPEGWAIIPTVKEVRKTSTGKTVKIEKEMATPNLPYGDIVVETICGVPTVTSWTPREMPEIPEAEAEPSAQDDTDTMLIDHEYRLTLLELGV